MENHFNCIYLYTNKVNGKKYVGQAVDFLTRHKRHIYSAYNEKQKRDYNVPFHNAIRRHGIENFEIKILKEDLKTKNELNYWESYYIVEFDTLAKNGKGYNLASGGEGGNTYAGKTNEELAEISRKISEAHKGEKHPMYGKHHSEETRAKLSEVHKGKSPYAGKSDEELAEISRKLSEAHKGKNKGKKNGRATLVDRFDKQGNYIDTMYQFEYVAIGFDKDGISRCCKGRYKTTGGYIFKYHEE